MLAEEEILGSNPSFFLVFSLLGWQGKTTENLLIQNCSMLGRPDGTTKSTIAMLPEAILDLDKLSQGTNRLRLDPPIFTDWIIKSRS